MLKKLTIKQLLLLAFLLAGLLPAMLVSFLSFYQTRNVLKQEMQQDMQALSITVANDLERMMLERMRNVQSWSQLSIMQEAAIGDVDKRLSIFLHGLANSYGDIYHAILVVDLQGNVIASSDAQRIGQRLAEKKPWFKTKDNVRPLVFSDIEGDTLAISQAVIDENTLVPMAMLVADFNWQAVMQLLNNAATEATAVALQDADGKVLASTKNWRSIRASHGIDATQLFSEQSPMSGWQVHTEKLRSVAIAPVHRLGYIFLALLFASILLAVFAARPIAQAIAEPIARLTDYVRSFTHETREVPPQSGPPEVRELGQAFEKMVHDLDQSQSDLTRAAKLAVVGEMAAAMSHEVRTPLGILRSSADVLKREADMSAEGKEVLTFIDAETERMNKLVSTLIDAARPRPPTFTNVNLSQLVQDNLAMLGTKADEKQIEISFEPTAKTIMAEVDADQMTQVIMNLVMNAIQVLPPQGRGLGLAVVRQIVQTHHGDIQYQQSKMGGAQFTIVLPNTMG